MRLFTGTSGYAYIEWKGKFYPKALGTARMLAYYGERFGTVEINSTFTKIPAATILERWSKQVPEGFVFALKAPRQITHRNRLNEVGEPVRTFLEVASVLGPRLGPILFQLPPNLKKDLGRLEAFLDLLPAVGRAAIEFRHASWFEADVYAALQSRGVALCIAHGEKVDTPLVSTADWGYLRLRRVKYTKADLRRWVSEIRAQDWSDVFVYFKHEDSATAPTLARGFEVIFGES